MIIGLILLLTPFSWAGRIVELTVRGAIGPATADYLSRGINNAHNATLILITIDTPGGLDKSTRQIVQDILSSKVPVVVYVAPKWRARSECRHIFSLCWHCGSNGA
ncbi:hypothetical protein [Legionella micdadei]|uniref:hypothetical protein n=1 Tax=Legionella micdadei TaxID=451 RepID=UPI0020A5771C|nr:hypothetical protein [Legionella micdadei]